MGQIGIVYIIILGLLAVISCEDDPSADNKEQSNQPVRCVNKTCSSIKYDYTKCYLDADVKQITNIELIDRLSFSFCNVGIDYGAADKVIFVNNGCRAKFSVCFTEVYVHLRPVTNITIESLTNNSVFIFWAAPENYNITDVVMDDENNTIVNNISANTSDNSNPQTGDNSGGLLAAAGKSTSEIEDTNDGMATEISSPILPPTAATDKSADNTTVDIAANDDTIVPLRLSYVDKYALHYFIKDSKMMLDVEANITEIQLSDLIPASTYLLYIAAHYPTGTILNSTEFSFTTKSDDPGSVSECHCDPLGSYNRGTCDIAMRRWCPCRPGYRGIFCEMCLPGYYRTSPRYQCHKCPCHQISSNERAGCYFSNGYVKCRLCKSGYLGNLCHTCKANYYRIINRCLPCDCHHNTNPRTYMCDVNTGACQHCIYNTTGFNCDICKPNYVGDAINAKNCTLLSDLPLDHPSRRKQAILPTGAIVGISIGVILLVSFIAGFIVYKRWSSHPRMKPFWTIELKEDHEGVNFSSLPDQENRNVSATRPAEDLDFYESYSNTKSSKQKYAPLREQI